MSSTSVAKAGQWPRQGTQTAVGHQALERLQKERWQQPTQTEEQGVWSCHGETPTAWQDVGMGEAPGRG